MPGWTIFGQFHGRSFSVDPLSSQCTALLSFVAWSFQDREFPTHTPLHPLDEVSLNSLGPRKPDWFLDIDLGGTSIKLGLFRGRELVERDQISTDDFASPTQAFLSAKSFVSRSLASASRTLDDLHAIGLAMAGVLDQDAALLQETANLRRWHGVDFRRELSSVFAKPVAVLNDANAAALAESVFGEHPSDSLALLTLGTGVGGGIIVDGRPLFGKHHCGGEIGHVAIEFGNDARDCGCGQPGHLEAYAGAAGVVRTARELLSRSGRPSLLEDHESLTPRDITVAAGQDDAIALEVIDRTAVSLGRAVAMLAQIADPSVVLLGGAMTFGGRDTVTGNRFLESIRNEVSRLTLVQIAKQLHVNFATLENDAGVFGAAHFASHFASPHPNDFLAETADDSETAIDK